MGFRVYDNVTRETIFRNAREWLEASHERSTASGYSFRQVHSFFAILDTLTSHDSVVAVRDFVGHLKQNGPGSSPNPPAHIDEGRLPALTALRRLQHKLDHLEHNSLAAKTIVNMTNVEFALDMKRAVERISGNFGRLYIEEAEKYQQDLRKTLEPNAYSKCQKVGLFR